MKLFGPTVAIVLVSLSFLGCSNKKNPNKDSQIASKRRNSPPQNNDQRDNAPQEIAFRPDGTLSIVSIDGTKLVSIEYERAETPETRSKGLMYRNSMGELQGMLFIHKDAAPRYMYMKNTYISLDILFLDNEKRIIKIYHNTQTRSEELLPSVDNARYALEVNAGFCERHGVHEGDLLEF